MHSHVSSEGEYRKELYCEIPRIQDSDTTDSLERAYLICQSFEPEASARAKCLDASGQLGVRIKARADIVPEEPIEPELVAKP